MKSLRRKVRVGDREYDCSLRKEANGYHYEVRGPVAVISGWVQGDVTDTLKEAQEHAKEKIPA